MDLTTRYLGLELRNPIVASAGPYGRTVAGVNRLAEAGVGAVVLASLFEEQLEREINVHGGLLHASEPQERSGYVPPGGSRQSPRGYLALIEKTAATTGIPVIASLNGYTTGWWTDYAVAMEQAGASAIELNLYFPQVDPLIPAAEYEQRHIEVLGTVKAVVSVPVAVKISPYLSSPGDLALRLVHAGADGLVLFNRFMQTGIDPETLNVDATFELSRPADAAFGRSWIARLRRLTAASLAASTGVDEAADVAAYLLAGADVVMTTSALLRHGPEHVDKLIYGLTGWMRRKGFESLDQVRGMLAEPVVREEAGKSDKGDEGQARTGYLTALQKATQRYSAGG
ncbi:MAG TPA: dihydroorotate dehydrogenase-like protein [Actinospica sp.]|jgi:dihydroorotate dehydrogenase (fumarate)|nr:dihydroorotate dehydrogenase-like protein [Actinospica sp.]